MPTKRITKTTAPLERPSNVNALGIANIISGSLNILTGLGATAALVLGTFGVGLLCAPITLLPAILGTFELIYGIKLVANPPQPVRPAQALAIVQIVAFIYLNVVSGVIGILALLFYNDPEVQAYFEELNS